MRGAFRRQLAAVEPEKCVVIDESGTTTAMTRAHGRAPPGVRVGDAVPLVHWQIMTIAAAVRLGDGVPGRHRRAGVPDVRGVVVGTNAAAGRRRDPRPPSGPQGRRRTRGDRGGWGAGAAAAAVLAGLFTHRAGVVEGQAVLTLGQS